MSDATPASPEELEKAEREKVRSTPPSRLFKLTEGSHLADVLTEIGGDFTVVKKPALFERDLSFLDGVVYTEKIVPIPGICALVREDTQEPIGSMSSGYGVVQFEELLSFTDQIAAEGHARFTGGKVTCGGARIHIEMKANQTLTLAGNDVIENYITASTSHDGSGCIQVMNTPRHKASQMTFVPLGKCRIKMRHTKHVKARLARVAKDVAKINEYWKEMSDAFRLISASRINDEKARLYFEMLLPPADDAKNKRAENIRNKMFDIYKFHGITKDFPSCQNTLFGALMATLQWIEYYKVVRKSTKGVNAADSKIESMLSGDAAKMKAEALGIALTLQEKLG